MMLRPEESCFLMSVFELSPRRRKEALAVRETTYSLLRSGRAALSKRCRKFGRAAAGGG